MFKPAPQLAEKIPQPIDPADWVQTADWYLAIDLGTTALSAVLLDRTRRKLYPLYWLVADELSATAGAPSAASQSFRLPAIAYLSPDQLAIGRTPQTPAAVAFDAIALATQHQTLATHLVAEQSGTLPLNGILLDNLKACLKINLLSGSPSQEAAPVLQWSDRQQLSLSWVQPALQALLSTLTVAQTVTESTAIANHPLSALQVQAEDLDRATLRLVLSNLQGVVLGYPVNWSDTYTFNIREAVLGAGLVTQPEQIILVEDAIAALLAELPQTSGNAALLPNSFWRHRTVDRSGSNGREAPWQGGTLVIDAGAICTDMALVNLPVAKQTLSYTDFSLRSLAYAGNAIDQDIICQLLYPQWLLMADQPRSLSKEASYLFHPALTLPLPAEPDPRTRHRLQQRLEASSLGRNLLQAARHLKQILSEQDSFSFELDNQQWTVHRRELESKVYVPFIQRLNRELNALLSYTGLSTPSIQQVVCTGGTASLGTIAYWLKQKLPNAVVIQDAYAEQDAPSRTAFGLAVLPLYSQVLDTSRQQYSDYFLLLELLRTLPNEPLPLGRIMQLLERQGINTRACQFRLLALLEGHLPPGLVPSQADAAWLTNESRQNPDYRALTATALFIKHGNQTYQPNPDSCDRLRHYLTQQLAIAYQRLEEPLTLDLRTPAAEFDSRN